MNRNSILVAVVLIILVAIGGYLLFGNQIKSKISSKAPSPAPTSSTGNRHEAVSDIEVVGTDFSFSPSTIVAKAKKPLKITFKNDGKMPHNLTIKGVGSSKTIQPGQSETFTVTPPK